MWQPSLFPTAVMLSLPKFGPHADIGYAPNSIWTFAALLLLAAGFLRSPRLPCISLAMVAVLVPLVLPVEDALKRSSQTVLRRYEAEHFCMSVVTAVGCIQDTVHRSAVDGPWIRLTPGAYEVAVAWRARLSGPLDRGTLRVTGGRGRTTIVQHDFRLYSGPGGGFAAVSFDVERTIHEVEFLVVRHVIIFG